MSQCEDFSRVSGFFGIISLCSWMCAQLPQIYANYKNKSAEGISPSFLMLWFMGDFLSFTSCLLNDVVLKFQVYLSLFFICNDIALCFQYYYYTSVYPKTHFVIIPRVDKDNEVSDPQENFAFTSDDVDIHHSDNITIHRNPISREEEGLSKSGSPSSYNSLDAPKVIAGIALNVASANGMPLYSRADSDILSNPRVSLGMFLAWCCTVVYVGSRCPQLYKNYKRKSVDGISPLLFGSALLGNLGYTLSIITSCDMIFSDDKQAFILEELPYILGSAGTIIFDVAYFYQRYLYRNSGNNTQVMGMEEWDV